MLNSIELLNRGDTLLSNHGNHYLSIMVSWIFYRVMFTNVSMYYHYNHNQVSTYRIALQYIFPNCYYVLAYLPIPWQSQKSFLQDLLILKGMWELVSVMLLQEVMERLQLSAVFLGSLASGPGYTYSSGDVQTMDYVLMDVEAVSLLSSCHTQPMDDLNMSAHLPITTCLMYEGCSVDQSCNLSRQLRVDWVGDIGVVYLRP